MTKPPAEVSAGQRNNPNERCLRIHEGALRTELLPQLMGQVFSSNTDEPTQAFGRHGSIRSNQDGSQPFMYSQSEIYILERKAAYPFLTCRTATVEQIEQALWKYYFLNPFSGYTPVFRYSARFVMGSSSGGLRRNLKKGMRQR